MPHASSPGSYTSDSMYTANSVSYIISVAPSVLAILLPHNTKDSHHAVMSSDPITTLCVLLTFNLDVDVAQNTEKALQR